MPVMTDYRELRPRARGLLHEVLHKAAFADAIEINRARLKTVRPSSSNRVGVANANLSSVDWSGARDLNPGPHGPESDDSSSKHVGFCVFQFDSSSRRARSVQICTSLQPDYYMKYFRVQVVQTGSSVIKPCDRPGIGRRQQRECHAHGSARLSTQLP